MKQIACLIALLSLLAGCNTTPKSTSTLASPRIAVAQQLIAQNKLADALQQSKILVLQFPQNPAFAEQVRTIASKIEQEKLRLLSTLNSQATEAQTKKILLRVLALDPNDLTTKARLRDLLSQQELANAKKKTSTIAKIFRRSNKKAQAEIKLSKLLQRMEDAHKQQDFTLLLSLASELNALAPKHPKFASTAYQAHHSLAQQYKGEKKYKLAIAHLEQSANYANTKQATKLAKEISQIKRERAKHYYTAAQKVFKQDLAQAINYLKKSLSFESENPKALQQLARAEKIKANLDRIKALR